MDIYFIIKFYNYLFSFSNIVMLKFASCILCPEMSEVIKMYLLPALKAQPSSTFPYSSLISALSSADTLCPDIKIEYSSWLLYSLLLLEPQNYGMLFLVLYLR